MNTQDENTSGPRTTIYIFGASIIAIVAYRLDAELSEVALWQAGLAAAIPFGALVLATVKAWPQRKNRNRDNDAA